MRPITVKEVEHVAFQLAKETMEWDEPLPDFRTRFPGILESCLANAFATFSKKDLYPSLTDKASIIFYQMIKNHPFTNGNKRAAVTTLFTFLYLNKKWLVAESEQVYQIAVWTAESQPLFKKEVSSAIKKFIDKNLVSLNK